MPIVKAEEVVTLVKQKEDLKVTSEQVKTIMKEDMGLGYRMARQVPSQANEARCLLLRQ